MRWQVLIRQSPEEMTRPSSIFRLVLKVCPAEGCRLSASVARLNAQRHDAEMSHRMLSYLISLYSTQVFCTVPTFPAIEILSWWRRTPENAIEIWLNLARRIS
jgi:hypothetical protein